MEFFIRKYESLSSYTVKKQMIQKNKEQTNY